MDFYAFKQGFDCATRDFENFRCSIAELESHLMYHYSICDFWNGYKFGVQYLRKCKYC